MDSADVIIIGAGVVGLAIAQRLSRAGRETIVVERHDGFGRETSSRNSEVIHGGFYYPEHSLKAALCVEGRRLLYELCGRENIPCRATGKLVVANTPGELETIDRLYDQGIRNGVEGLRVLSAREVERHEPGIVAKKALLSPATGIVDTHALMKFLEVSAGRHGATIAYGCEVVGLEQRDGGWRVEVVDVDGGREKYACAAVVNAAGLEAGRVASMAGIDIDAAGYRIHPCKGEYFSVSSRHRGRLRHLVYPAPTAVSLGIHAVLGLDGGLKLGPNAFFVDTIDYNVDEGHLTEFYESARRYLPFIDKSDLRPDQAGIRPKLQRPGDAFRDFVISGEQGPLKGLVNLIGIESPGLTACLAIAGEVERIVES
jgi:L-2-hydroxyglutarate oxidase LhgO